MKKPNRADDREGYELVCVEMFNADSHTYINREYMTHEGTLIQRRGNTMRFYRPIKKSWSGDGLPPVGTVCEAIIADGFGSIPWTECTVIHHYDQSVAVAHGGGRLICWANQFRPIRTQAQIEAEERSRECDKIYGIISRVERPGNKSDMAEALYDAGYRKGESK